MKRLLIVITRMYAHQGDNKDEFVEIWQGGANTEHRIFALQNSSRDDYVLVLHGYEYPQQVQVATLRARAQVEAAIRSTDLLPRLPARRTGVMFHPRQSWTPVAQMEIADGMKIWLCQAGAAVDYIQSYHHGSIIDKKLAPACLQRQDFSSVLDELWGIFLRLAVAGYARRLENLTKELTSILSTIRRENLGGINSDNVAGPESFRHSRQTAHGALTRARHLVLDERAESDSIVKLIWDVAEKVDEQKKEKLISALAELENLFSQTDLRYQQAVSAFQGSESESEVGVAEKTFSERKLEVRSKLVESDQLKTWYQAIFNVLSALGQTLNE